MSLNPKQKSEITGFIKQEAEAMGFFDCSISKVAFLKDASQKVEQWLENGHHASMNYMERNREKRYNPGLLVEKAKSIITVLYNYYPATKLPEKNNYKISKYAYGKDYHFVIKQKLNKLLEKTEAKTGPRIARVFVDSAPVFDKAWAVRAGLGWIGKNGMLINKKLGSFVFVGELMLTLPLQADAPFETGHCGSCTACLDACPTDAIVEDYLVDSRRCISYLTIEHRGDLPDEFAGQLGEWIYGCDICQEVCPWNQKFSQKSREPLFAPTSEIVERNPEEWSRLTEEEYRRIFRNSPVKRAKFTGLKRNIQSVLSNS